MNKLKHPALVENEKTTENLLERGPNGELWRHHPGADDDGFSNVRTGSAAPVAGDSVVVHG